MPTYEYACRDCGEHLEVVQSFKDDALTTCPNCSGSLRKVFSAAGIIFKGSGWHVKDYATSGKRANGSGEGADAPKEDSTSDTVSSGDASGSKSDKKAEAGSDSTSKDPKVSSGAPSSGAGTGSGEAKKSA